MYFGENWVLVYIKMQTVLIKANVEKKIVALVQVKYKYLI
jgi:hypothetical protein